MRSAAFAFAVLAVAPPISAADQGGAAPSAVDPARLMKQAFETGEADSRTALLLAQWVLTARTEEIVPAFVDVLTSSAATEMKTGDPAWDDVAQATVSAFVRLLQDGQAHRRPDPDRLMRELAPVARAAVPAVVQALGEVDPDAREALGQVLRTIAGGARPAVPLLADGLKDRDAAVRAATATALGALGPSASAAVPALTVALGDPDPRVREAATAALKRIQPN
ncbi:MAG TPA: HEAT repeat domain-containing protein [Vicinamibacteria bacterium]